MLILIFVELLLVVTNTIFEKNMHFVINDEEYFNNECVKCMN